MSICRDTGGKMKRVLLLALGLSIAILVSGCASLAGVFGIASESYVEEQLTSVREEMQSEIADAQRGATEAKAAADVNKSAIDEFAATADQLGILIESIQQTVETTEELKRLGAVLEERLVNLPVETIRQLVGILNEYLETK